MFPIENKFLTLECCHYFVGDGQVHMMGNVEDVRFSFEVMLMAKKNIPLVPNFCHYKSNGYENMLIMIEKMDKVQ